VGKAINLKNRVKSYFSSKKKLLPKTAALVSQIAKIDYTITESEVDALLLEANFIQKLKPKYNLAGKDDKSAPFIEIPSLKIVHRQKPGLKYFGPYLPGSNIRQLLRFLKIHLEVFPFTSNYEENLKKLVNFLSGKRKLVQKQLAKEMAMASKNQQFERAQKIKESLQQIEYLTSGKFKPWQYEQNPNLISDLRQKELDDLKNILKLEKLERIEAYDISHTAGKQVVGSMVVFTNGIKDSKWYRRFKTKTEKNDDVAAMGEILNRRLKHIEWPWPELIVVDGGLSQLTAAMSEFQKTRKARVSENQNFRHSDTTDISDSPSFPIRLKIIALAKREEIISTDEGQEIHLPKNSPALHLLQRLRNEAHRFSQKYHLLLRNKKMLS
jgi:excinuclease ABC subunit C